MALARTFKTAAVGLALAAFGFWLFAVIATAAHFPGQAHWVIFIAALGAAGSTALGAVALTAGRFGRFRE